jgi:hypothetical protein
MFTVIWSSYCPTYCNTYDLEISSLLSSCFTETPSLCLDWTNSQFTALSASTLPLLIFCTHLRPTHSNCSSCFYGYSHTLWRFQTIHGDFGHQIQQTDQKHPRSGVSIFPLNGKHALDGTQHTQLLLNSGQSVQVYHHYFLPVMMLDPSCRLHHWSGWTPSKAHPRVGCSLGSFALVWVGWWYNQTQSPSWKNPVALVRQS